MTEYILNKIELSPVPLQKIDEALLSEKGIKLFIKRIDLVHPFISGNKWFKLKYNLVEAYEKGFDTLLSFGGAYSNHIHALSAAGKLLGFKTIGVIRGEEHLPLNPTLSFAKDYGMILHYINRSEYRNKYSDELIQDFKNRFGNFYLIPEGGSNELAVKGCKEIVKEIEIPFDYVCSACGTAGTISGIISGLESNQKALGFAVLKGAQFLNDNVNYFLKKSGEVSSSNWKIIFDYHIGGYAKINSELINFIDSFREKHNIPLDPVYTGKMIYAIYDLIKKNYFPAGSTIIAIHTGGLQGIDGMKDKMEFILNQEKKERIN